MCPHWLEDDIRRLSEHQPEQEDEDTNEDLTSGNQHYEAEEWMLICCNNANYPNTADCDEDYNRSSSSTAYANFEELPTFITRHRQSGQEHQFTTTANHFHLQGKQLAAYNLVKHHMESDDPTPLRMIISGTARTGKSYLIHCLRLLLHDKVRVVAPTGVAAFNVDGSTLHSLLYLPTKGDFKDLEGENLNRLQQSLAVMKYIIIDEMSMVGRKLFGQVDRRLRQVFPQHSNQPLGGCSCLLFGDFGQLPPVMDLPLYTTLSSSTLSDIGSSCYQTFNRAVVLDQIMRQSGHDPSQVMFRDILLQLRNCELTENDWKHLMTRTPAHIFNASNFDNALHLFPTAEAVVEHNINKLHGCGQPVTTIKAVHTGVNASKASADDASGLQPVVCLTKGARVMLSSNPWVDMGLVNGAMGTVKAICYHDSGAPPDLPVAITVLCDNYSGSTLSDGTVPIVPIRRLWSTSGNQCSCLQIPLKLAWAITTHKAQGLTLPEVSVDIGKKEFCADLTFVAISCVRCLTDFLLSPPFPFQGLRNLSKSCRVEERKREEKRLEDLEAITLSSSLAFTYRTPSQDVQLSTRRSAGLQIHTGIDVAEVQSTPSSVLHCMEQTIISPISQNVNHATPLHVSQHMEQATPSPVSQYMEESTPPVSQCAEQSTPSLVSQYMEESIPSLLSLCMEQSTPSPLSQYMEQSTPSPVSQYM